MDRKEQLLKERAKIDAELEKIRKQEEKNTESLTNKAYCVIWELSNKLVGKYIRENLRNDRRYLCVTSICFKRICDKTSFSLEIHGDGISYDTFNNRVYANVDAMHGIYSNTIYCCADYDGNLLWDKNTYEVISDEDAMRGIAYQLNMIVSTLLKGKYELKEK